MVSTRAWSMASVHSLEGLIEGLRRNEWRDAFERLPDSNLGLASANEARRFDLCQSMRPRSSAVLVATS